MSTKNGKDETKGEDTAVVSYSEAIVGGILLKRSQILDAETGEPLNPTQVFNRLHAYTEEALLDEPSSEEE